MALSPRDSHDRRAQRNRTRLRKLANGRVRLSVFRSDKNIYAQVIDDAKGVTIAAASTLGEKALADAAREAGLNF
jgi:large subunit ribosomal protein L18